MSLIKLANQINDLQNDAAIPDRANKFADYIIPATKGGSLLGASAGGAYSILKGPKKLSNLKNIAKATGTGAIVGGGVGFTTSPITSKVGEGGKALTAKALPKKFSDDLSAETLHGLSSGIGGSIAGGLVGKRLQTLGKIKGKGALKGSVLGGISSGTVGASFESEIQKGKERRKEKRKRREEYNEIKNKI